MTTIRFVILVAGLMLFTGYASGQGGAVKPAPGAEVTIKGILLWEKACAPDESAVGDGQVLYAVDGTPEVKAEMDRLMKECYTSDTLNAEQAVKVLERFNERLKYYLVPSSIIDKKGCQYANPAVAVTGVLSEKDGKKWITPSKIVPEFKLKYPDRMLMPDKPFLVPGKDPLLLKVNDKLSLKCILIPPGKFLMRLPFYVWPRYQDEYPRLITLTKPYYLAEIPVTQEIYEALMGNNPSEEKDPQLPVQNVPCADILKFCQILSEKNGRKVHLPTFAQWEYAAVVGASSPPFNQKFKEQSSMGPKGAKCPLPVKTAKPNAWGLYNMADGVWLELTSDIGKTWRIRKDEVDPSYPCTEAEKTGKKHEHIGAGARHSAIGYEDIPDTGRSYCGTKFRISVEPTPEEIAALAKEQAGGK